jgi:hypothetical protein
MIPVTFIRASKVTACVSEKGAGVGVSLSSYLEIQQFKSRYDVDFCGTRSSKQVLGQYSKLEQGRLYSDHL